MQGKHREKKGGVLIRLRLFSNRVVTVTSRAPAAMRAAGQFIYLTEFPAPAAEEVP